MSTDTVSVIVCDDSALMRNLVGKMVEKAEGLSLAGKAMNGKFLLQKIPKLNPDIIVLDLEMPEVNGIDFLKERQAQGMDIPVVILSSVAQRGAKITMEALSLGASDFILKPSGSVSEDIHKVESQLVEMLWGYGIEYRRKKGKKPLPEDEDKKEQKQSATARRPSIAQERRVKEDRKERERGTGEPAAKGAEKDRKEKAEELTPVTSPVSRSDAGALEIVAIGISTGGPNALRKLFADIPADFPLPMVVVQHMPAGFTGEFAKSLDRICPLEVKEASDGDLLKAGRILICPGNFHIEVERRRLAGVVRLSQGDLVNGHRPSADILFASVAKHYGGRALGVIMTGMGRDGAKEIGGIHKKGGITIAQDRGSSIVYGMPKVAAEMGHIQHIEALDRMALTISKLVRENISNTA